MFSKMMVRQLSTTPVRRASAGENKAKTWKNLSLFVALPIVIFQTVNVALHMMHERECPPPRPEFIPYEYMYIRNKRFPWGDGRKTLFHNPHLNALPDGYEDEE